MKIFKTLYLEEEDVNEFLEIVKEEGRTTGKVFNMMLQNYKQQENADGKAFDGRNFKQI